jgi:hypothetical protein
LNRPHNEGSITLIIVNNPWLSTELKGVIHGNKKVSNYMIVKELTTFSSSKYRLASREIPKPIKTAESSSGGVSKRF